MKTQFCFHTDSDLLFINGRAVPAARERSNAAEVGWARWDKKEVGKLTPGTDGVAGASSGACSAAATRRRGSGTWTRSAPTR